MNNKGQSLVLFILFIPILLGIIVLVIDVGRTIEEKNSINNKIELVIEYGLEDNLTSEELTKLLEYNLDNCENTIKIENNVIEVNSKTYVKGILSNILNFKGFNIESVYRGYLKENKKIIEKVK